MGRLPGDHFITSESEILFVCFLMLFSVCLTFGCLLFGIMSIGFRSFGCLSIAYLEFGCVIWMSVMWTEVCHVDGGLSYGRMFVDLLLFVCKVRKNTGLGLRIDAFCG